MRLNTSGRSQPRLLEQTQCRIVYAPEMIYFKAGMLERLISKGKWEKFNKEFGKEFDRFLLYLHGSGPRPMNPEFQRALFDIFWAISLGVVGNSSALTRSNDTTPIASKALAEGVQTLQYFAIQDVAEGSIDSYNKSRSLTALEMLHKHRVSLSITRPESTDWTKLWRNLASDFAPALEWMN